MIMLNNYSNAELLVNRIKAEDNCKLLHVNRMNGKRVNGWIRVSESVALTDASGDAKSWDSMSDGVYYTMKIEEHNGISHATIFEAMWTRSIKDGIYYTIKIDERNGIAYIFEEM